MKKEEMEKRISKLEEELEMKTEKLFEATKMSANLLIYLINAIVGITSDDTVEEAVEKIDQMSSKLREETK